jgi:hypothetical protein
MIYVLRLYIDSKNFLKNDKCSDVCSYNYSCSFFRNVRNHWDKIKVWVSKVYRVCSIAIESSSSPVELRRELLEMKRFASFGTIEQEHDFSWPQHLSSDLPSLEMLIVTAADLRVCVDAEIKILQLVISLSSIRDTNDVVELTYLFIVTYRCWIAGKSGN